MNIQSLPIAKLKFHEKNPRKIDKIQFDKLCKNIEEDPEFFKMRPCLVNSVDGKLIIYAGNQRARAAKKIGFKEVPCIVVDNLDEETMKKRVVLDNLHHGEFDYDMLACDYEIEDLVEMGMSEKELGIISEIESNEIVEDDEETLSPLSDADSKTKLGDLYELNGHRLVCGDSVNPITIENLLNKKEIDMVYTDPPYGIKVAISDGKKYKNSAIARNKFNPILNDDSTQTAIDSFNLCFSMQIPVMVWWGANYYAEALPPSSCWIVWDKDVQNDNFADAELAWCNSKTAVRIFKHTWSGMIKGSEHGERRVHPTQKPIALAEWCIEKYGSDCKNILDLFVGSGSTLMACEKLKKIFFGIELSPAYCDIIVNRWKNWMIKNNKSYIIKLNGENIDN